MSTSQHSTDVFFDRACPVCGRTLHIRVQLLGRRVYCQHCGGGFTATDESLGGDPPVRDRVEDLLTRASQVLAQAAGAAEDADGVSG